MFYVYDAECCSISVACGFVKYTGEARSMCFAYAPVASSAVLEYIVVYIDVDIEVVGEWGRN